MGEQTTNNNYGQSITGKRNKINGSNEVKISGGLPQSTQADNYGMKIAGEENEISGTNKVELDLRVSPEAAPVINTLFLFSNPRISENQQRLDGLRLNEEQQAIEEALRLSRYRDRIQMHPLPITTATDLRRALLDPDWNYQIVHLSGHGASSGFLLENEHGRARSILPEDLGNYFRLYRDTIRCVILNACHTLSTGEFITLGIPYVIAMSGPIHDRAAIEFSRGFYDAIGADKDIERAYQEGMSAVRFARLDQNFLALLLQEQNH
jgi:CHAT domain